MAINPYFTYFESMKWKKQNKIGNPAIQKAFRQTDPQHLLNWDSK